MNFFENSSDLETCFVPNKDYSPKHEYKWCPVHQCQSIDVYCPLILNALECLEPAQAVWLVNVSKVPGKLGPALSCRQIGPRIFGGPICHLSGKLGPGESASRKLGAGWISGKIGGKTVTGLPPWPDQNRPQKRSKRLVTWDLTLEITILTIENWEY